jgi:signal transduction histidine kinase
MIVELNASVLRGEIFPELVQKYFKGSSGLDYHVAIVTGENGANILYATDKKFSQGDASSDASLNLVGPPFSPGQVPLPPGTWPMERFNQPPNAYFDRLVHFEPLDRSADGVWKLVVRHQRGSVEAAVAALRRRNLAVSFGVLLLLAVSMGIIVISSQRANRLAQLQMEFIAGVSHEVRTPLAVIASAAENMAHGVIAEKDQIVRYGNSILNQTRQLTHLVEQVLQFAAVQQGGRKYELRPTDVHEAVSLALENSAAVTRKAGVAIEVTLADDLPLVMADFTALVQSLQNLITNAAKYGAGGGWIRISSAVRLEKGKPVELQISVADKGMGISKDELVHIFEPFYRAPSVAGSQIHGTGLGLPLTRAAIEAMGGRVVAESELNRGSIFTIRLPVTTERAITAEQERAGQTTHPHLSTPAEDPTT